MFAELLSACANRSIASNKWEMIRKENLPAVLYSVALASMAWSRAAHCAISILAVICFLITSENRFKQFSIPFFNYFIFLLGFIGVAFALSPVSSAAAYDLKGVWPLLHLAFAPIIFTKSNRSLFTKTFLSIAGLAAIYSILQYFWIIPHKSKHGGYVTSSEIWAFVDCLTYAVPVCLYLAIKNKGKQKLLLFGLCAIFMTSLWINQERANFFSAVCCLGIVLLLNDVISLKAKSLCLAAVVAFGLVGTQFSDSKIGSVSQIFENPAEILHPIRIAQYEVAYKAFMLSPYIGHGLGSYHTFQENDLEHSKYLMEHTPTGVKARVHSMPLQILVSTGLLGLAIVFGFFLKLLLPLFRQLRTNNMVAVIGISACAIHLLTSLTDSASITSVRLAAFTITIGFVYGNILSPNSSQQRS
jgi:O-antigen ligase